MEPVTLTTARLYLRPLGDADIEALHQACQDDEIQRWTTVPSPYQRTDAQTFVREITPRGWAHDTMYHFGAFERAGSHDRRARGDALVASVGLSVRSADRGVLELGFWTAREQRGQGYVTEAAAALCHWAFGTLRARRVEWRALKGNLASRHVAERIGFTLEGTLRNQAAHRGAIQDEWIGSLLPQDLGYPPATVPGVSEAPVPNTPGTSRSAPSAGATPATGTAPAAAYPPIDPPAPSAPSGVLPSSFRWSTP